MVSVQRLEIHSTNGKKLLGPIDLELPDRVVLGVYGPNGSGKSTLLRALAGISHFKAQTGSIDIDYKPISGFPSRARAQEIIYLGSEFHTEFHLTVNELFQLAENISGKKHRGEVIECMGLGEYLARDFRTLSDGEKQWTMLARALIQGPKVLVLDETVSKMDLDRLHQLVKIIKNAKERPMSFMIASHDLNFISEVADSLLILKKGNLIACGELDHALTEHTLRELYPEVPAKIVLSPETGKRKVLI